MVISENSKRTNWRCVQMCVLLCATVVLPLRTASAADYEAVGKRLRAAVEAGEITAGEARIMLRALRRGAQAEGGDRVERDRGEKSITVEEYKRAEAKMRKIVEAGEAKPEDVKRRLIEMRKMTAGRSERGVGKDVDWAGIKKRIEAAVKSGKMTREEADVTYKEMKMRMAGKAKGDSKRIGREKYRKAESEIHRAIAAGKLTKEQGREKLAGLRKMIGEKSEAAAKKKGLEAEHVAKKAGGEDYSKAARKIREAVAAGKLTKEQGREKLAEIRKQIGENKDAPAKKKSREGQAKKDVDWEAVKKKIEGAVKSGRITRKEADAKYEAIKKRMAGGDKL